MVLSLHFLLAWNVIAIDFNPILAIRGLDADLEDLSNGRSLAFSAKGTFGLLISLVLAAWYPLLPLIVFVANPLLSVLVVRNRHFLMANIVAVAATVSHDVDLLLVGEGLRRVVAHAPCANLLHEDLVVILVAQRGACDL